MDPTLPEALEVAVVTCRQALADYRAGILDDLDLQRALVQAGVVRTDGELWLLDLERGRWLRYDGLSLETPRHPLTPHRLSQLVQRLPRTAPVDPW